ncbi:hypothetical protein JCM10213_005995, partial [Rhodosporidiobolus nylandii]
IDSPTPLLSADPSSRLAALLLPTNTGGDSTLALLPFFADELDWDSLGMDRSAAGGAGGAESIPYAPSHLLPLSSLGAGGAGAAQAARSSTLQSQLHSGNANAFLPTLSSPPIRNVVSMAFLPGFTEPTLALLYAPDWTWSGRLEHLAHNWLVSLVTLSSVSSSATASSPSSPEGQRTRAVVISTSPPLPYSCLSLAPCPPSLGGVLLTTANGLLHVDQSGRVVAAPVNAWLARDFPPGRARPAGLDGAEGAQEGEKLEGSRIEWLAQPADDDSAPSPSEEGQGGEPQPQALLWAPSGAIFSLTFQRTGRTIAALRVERVARGEGVTGGAASVVARIAGGGSGGKGEGYVFVGSEQGSGALVRWTTAAGAGKGKEEVKKEVLQEQVKVEEDRGGEMELDDDEDIYNTSSAPAPTSSLPTPAPGAAVPAYSSSAASSAASAYPANPSAALVAAALPLHLEVCDVLDGFGAVRELGMGLVDDENPPELIAATGAGKSAGLTVFHRTLPLTSRRPLHLPSSAAPSAEADSLPPFVATDGVWKLKLSPLPGAGGGGAGGAETGEVWVASGGEEGGTMIYRPTPDSSNGGLTLATQLPHPTLFATTLSSGSCLLLLTPSSLLTFSPSLAPVQTLPFLHGAAHPTAHPLNCSATDEYVVVHLPVGQGARAKTAPRVYRFDEPSGGVVEVEGWEGQAEARAAVFASSRAESLPLVRPAAATAAAQQKQAGAGQAGAEAMDEDEDDLYGGGGGAGKEKEEDMKPAEREKKREEESRVLSPPAGEGWEMLAEVGKEGELNIRLLPSLNPIFRTPRLTLLPPVLLDTPCSSSSSSSEPEPDLPPALDLDDLKLDRILLARVGPHGQEKPHLFVLLANGTLAVYEAFASMSSVPPPSAAASASAQAEEPRLAVRWVKTLVRHLPTAPRRKGASASDLPPPRRELVPFSSVAGHAGVFLTGEEALWILKGPHGPAFAREAGVRGVYGFVGLSELGEGQKEERTLSGEQGYEGGEFAVQTREGMSIARLPPSLSLSSSLAYTSIPKDRLYNHLAFDLSAGLYVASTLNETRFVAFDEEGVPLFKEEAPGLVEPTNYQSTLEVLVPGSWDAIHGFEFRQNEFVTALKTVSLASASTATGQRDFIAVGTAVYRGEDLATRGGLYLFELIRVNPHPSTPHLDHQLRQLFFEDTKAVVNSVCDLNGYLFLSMGQKLYARAFEQDEFLLSVGFLDVGVHVTSLQAMKNFLLIGDAVQSVALVAFQEDPYKLVLLGRDFRPTYVSNANFLVNEGKVAFVAGDDKGVLRLFEYDPTNIASSAGQRLLCRTEYFGGAESTATMLFAKHLPGEDPKQNGILYGGLDGSLATLVPVRDAVFRRLASLQSLMTRHVLHFGGLNPRGYRIVKNDTVSRALQKGILDGDLLAGFEYLSVDRQTELADACGTDADTVRANLRSLRGWE